MNQPIQVKTSMEWPLLIRTPKRTLQGWLARFFCWSTTSWLSGAQAYLVESAETLLSQVCSFVPHDREEIQKQIGDH